MAPAVSAPGWVQDTVTYPPHRNRDADGMKEHSYRGIPQAASRQLHVVYRPYNG
jgi:hypothetical protein